MASLARKVDMSTAHLANAKNKGSVGGDLAQKLAKVWGMSWDELRAAAAAIVAPRDAFLDWHADVGDDLPALAAAFRVTETCMAMRIGEVTGRPVIVVAPGHAHVRGEAWEWGDLVELRSCTLPRGVARVRLTDAPRRIVVSAA